MREDRTERERQNKRKDKTERETVREDKRDGETEAERGQNGERDRTEIGLDRKRKKYDTGQRENTVGQREIG